MLLDWVLKTVLYLLSSKKLLTVCVNKIKNIIICISIYENSITVFLHLSTWAQTFCNSWQRRRRSFQTISAGRFQLASFRLKRDWSLPPRRSSHWLPRLLRSPRPCRCILPPWKTHCIIIKYAVYFTTWCFLLSLISITGFCSYILVCC